MEDARRITDWNVEMVGAGAALGTGIPQSFLLSKKKCLFYFYMYLFFFEMSLALKDFV